VDLCPTRYKTGHFGYVPQANLLGWYGKTKHNTTKAHIHQSKEMYNTKCLYIKCGKMSIRTSVTLGVASSVVNDIIMRIAGLLVSCAFYDIQRGNGEGLFSFCCFINLPLTYLDTYPLFYSLGTHTGQTFQEVGILRKHFKTIHQHKTSEDVFLPFDISSRSLVGSSASRGFWSLSVQHKQITQ